MKNIHVIPTDKPSRLCLDSKDKLWFAKNSGYTIADGKVNIYITSTEEIKEGDWYLVELFKITGESDGFHIEKCTKLDDVWCNNFDVISTRHKDNCKKIILTDNPDLIKDGVQAIDDEFLEWFVKNPSCEEVEVDKGYRGVNLFNYKIIIPKEELHSMDDEVECNMCGGYMYLLPDNSMYVCTNSECTRCYEEEDEEPEQETLEEAKQEQKQHLIDLMRLDEQGTLEEVSPMNDLLKDLRETKISVKESIDIIEYEFIRTQINIFVQKTLDSVIDRIENELLEKESKWQQEQDKKMYSEEEVLDAWELGAKEGLPLTRKKKEKLFEQFKKSKNESNT
jgi:hypothetical protein